MDSTIFLGFGALCLIITLFISLIGSLIWIFSSKQETNPNNDKKSSNLLPTSPDLVTDNKVSPSTSPAQPLSPSHQSPGTSPNKSGPNDYIDNKVAELEKKIETKSNEVLNFAGVSRPPVGAAANNEQHTNLRVQEADISTISDQCRTYYNVSAGISQGFCNRPCGRGSVISKIPLSDENAPISCPKFVTQLAECNTQPCCYMAIINKCPIEGIFFQDIVSNNNYQGETWTVGQNTYTLCPAGTNPVAGPSPNKACSEADGKVCRFSDWDISQCVKTGQKTRSNIPRANYCSATESASCSSEEKQRNWADQPNSVRRGTKTSNCTQRGHSCVPTETGSHEPCPPGYTERYEVQIPYPSNPKYKHTLKHCDKGPNPP